MRECSILGCAGEHFAKGFCKSHYYSASTNPSRKHNICSRSKCSRVVHAKGLCATHYRKLPEVMSRVRTCSKCSSSYTGANCKTCHSKRESTRRAKFNPQERENHLQKHRKWHSKFRRTLNKRPIEKQAHYWAKRTLKRALTGGRYQSRSIVPLNTLITLALKGLKKFPYMNFSSIRGVDKIADRASLDKINPKGQYLVDNIRVVPLWLNMAKCDLTESEFKSRLKQYLTQKREATRGNPK